MLGSDLDVDVDEVDEAQEVDGKLAQDDDEDKLMRSVMQNDKKSVDKGQLLNEALNQGITSFNPDIMFESLVNNYNMAKRLMGESLIRLISGYNSSYIEKNINIPEFKRELKKKITENVENLKDEKLISRDGSISDKGLFLASLILYTQELDSLLPKGDFGEKVHKKNSLYGDRVETRKYKRGDRYRDVEIKESLKVAMRRGHTEILDADLRTSRRQSRGKTDIIYAIDASGSMKGKKIEMSKKAGVALAFKAIEKKDNVGLIVFGSEIKEEIPPTNDFSLLLKTITRVKASKQTDFKEMLRSSLTLFPKGETTKHLLILTDAMPTVGNDPQKESLKEVAKMREAGVTVSIVGINLDKEAEKFAQKLAEVGDGRLFVVREVEELDKIVLEDYYSL